MNEERAREYFGLKGQVWEEVEDSVTKKYGMKFLYAEPVSSMKIYRNHEAAIVVKGERIIDIQLKRIQK